MGQKLTASPNLNQLFTSPASLLSEVSQDAIVGSFQMEGGYFLILAVSSLLEPPTSLEYTHLMSCDFVTGQFQKNNQTYLIIEADPPTHHTYAKPAPRAEAPDPPLALVQSLTDRELQIATFIAQGWSNKQVAAYLTISEWTVATHLRRIFMKLQVDSRAAMVYKCAGLIQQIRAEVQPAVVDNL